LILIVSANPLFREVILHAIAQMEANRMVLSPEAALERIDELKPEVIILDETIAEPGFEYLLSRARALQKTRVIVLNPLQNEVMLLDLRRTCFNEAGDLVKAIIDQNPFLAQEAPVSSL
jgi:chemotaxis response regulator CheB